MGMTDNDWMQLAFEQALVAQAEGEVPVGAVLVSSDNRLISSGFNHMIHLHDPTAHAEIMAIRAAGVEMHNYRLEDTTLYVTLEPCPMCASAIVQARVKRLVFATRNLKMGAAGSVCDVFHPDIANHAVHIDEGVLKEPCMQLLKDFFKAKRD